MKISVLWSFIGLAVFGVAHGGFRSHSSTAEESSPATATTASPQVNVASTLSNYDGLNLIHNHDKKTIGFVNVTENVGVSFVLHEGGDIKILLDSKTGHVLHFQHLNDVSLTQNEKQFGGDVLKALDSILQNYIYRDEPIPGNSTAIESSSEDALTLWSEVYLHLGHPKEKGNKDFRNLKYVPRFLKRLKHLFVGSLKGLLGQGTFPLKQNLNRFLTISVGLHKLFNKADGGLKAILAKNVSFEMNSLFNAKNGAEVLVYVLRQTGAKFDLTIIFSKLWNNYEDNLDIIAKLGGGESRNGVDETFALVGHFWAAAHQQISFTDFVQYLFQSSTEDHWSQADDGDLQQVYKDVKNITDQQSKKYDNLVKFSGFVKFFTNLTTNNLIDNNVNISALVEKWRKRDAIGGLKVMSEITFKFFSPEKYSDLFFNGFTAFLNATSDPEAVKRLIPGVSLENLSGNGGSILNSSIKSYNIDEQLKKGGDATQILNGVPVFSEFSKIYRDAVGNNFDFSKVLNGGTLSDYLSKNPFLQPFKLGVDGFSKFFQESGNVVKHIFIDPIQHFIPSQSIIPNLPFLQPGGSVIPSASTEKTDAEKGPTLATKPDDDDVEEKITSSVVTATKKTSEETETESQSKEKPTISSSESASTEKPPTSGNEDDDSDTQKTTESSDKETTPCTKVVEISASAEETIEDRHHHGHRVENRHHVHHYSREHHKEKHNDPQHIAHKYKHNHQESRHEKKHDTKKHQVHQDKHHQQKSHHSIRKNAQETHEDKVKDIRQRAQYAEGHHGKNYHKQEDIQH